MFFVKENREFEGIFEIYHLLKWNLKLINFSTNMDQTNEVWTCVVYNIHPLGLCMCVCYNIKHLETKGSTTLT
jgi:hypothetical protein